MALLVWLPLNGDLKNYGVSNLNFSLSSPASVNLSGKIGSCYYNNSHSSGYIISDKTIHIPEKQTMCCWLKFADLESSASLGGGVCGQHRYSTNTGMGVTIKYVSSTTGYLSINTGTGSSRTYNTYCGSTLLSANTWYHVGFSYNGSIAKLYLNGNIDGTHSIGTMSCPADYFHAFAWSLSGSSGLLIHSDYHLYGYLNDVRLYDECLSDEQVREISKGLVARYPLNDPYIEGTTNISARSGASGWNNSGAASWSSSDTSMLNVPNTSCPVYSIILTTAGLSAIIFGNAAVSGAKTITASVWYYLTMAQASGSDIGPYVRSSKTDSALVNFSYNGSTNFRSWPVGKWLYLTATCTTASTETGVYFCAYTAALNLKFAFNAWQIEEKDHATPYTPSTRSNQKVYDTSGYLRHGVINNTSVSIKDDSSPRYNRCLYNPSTVYPIKCTVNLPAQNALTFSWWEKINTWGLQTSGIFSTSNSDATDYQATAANMRDGCFDCTNTDGTTKRVDVGSYLSTNVWQHCVLTFDGSALKFYVNGVLKTTVAQTGSLKDFKYLYLFYSCAGGVNRVCIGDLSDFRIYSTALSESDIKHLYANPISVTNTGSLMTQGEVIEE